MKCPKCGYLGFERVERCRNCGYEFSLASTAPTPELPIRDRPPATSRFEDLPLERPASGAAQGPDELPLFAARTPTGDEPLIKRASPLAVRAANSGNSSGPCAAPEAGRSSGRSSNRDVAGGWSRMGSSGVGDVETRENS